MTEQEQRAELGKQMVENLMKIAQLSGQSIPHMEADENGVFREVKNADQEEQMHHDLK